MHLDTYMKRKCHLHMAYCIYNSHVVVNMTAKIIAIQKSKELNHSDLMMMMMMPSAKTLILQ